MYEFAIVALLALALYKTVDFLTALTKMDEPAFRLITTLGLGVVATWLLDYSVFAQWDITIREAWMGSVFTGLIVGGFTYVWHEALGVLEGYGRRQRDEALEIENRMPRAA